MMEVVSTVRRRRCEPSSLPRAKICRGYVEETLNLLDLM